MVYELDTYACKNVTTHLCICIYGIFEEKIHVFNHGWCWIKTTKIVKNIWAGELRCYIIAISNVGYTTWNSERSIMWIYFQLMS